MSLTLFSGIAFLFGTHRLWRACVDIDRFLMARQRRAYRPRAHSPIRRCLWYL